jgi:hypothetical protein
VNFINHSKQRINICLIILSLLFISSSLQAQASRENPVLKWTTWIILQTLPSPVFFEDNGNGNKGTEFGFEWQVTPLCYTFKPNKYLSHFSSFFIKPVKKFTGSAELFFTPQYALSSFDYSKAQKYMYNAGARVYFPLVQGGEYLSFSLGAGYYSQKNELYGKVDGVMYEAGLYSVFGMFGLKFAYKQNAVSKYNVGFYLKYY